MKNIYMAYYVHKCIKYPKVLYTCVPILFFSDIYVISNAYTLLTTCTWLTYVYVLSTYMTTIHDSFCSVDL